MAISQICRLSEEVLTGDLLEAVFIDQAIKDPNSKEADAEFVLQATYATVPLRGLVELMAQRLRGEHPKGAVVIRGDVGSGKSHTPSWLFVTWLHWAGRPSGALMNGICMAVFAEYTTVALVQLVAKSLDTVWQPLFKHAGARKQCPDLHQSTHGRWTSLGIQTSEVPKAIISYDRATSASKSGDRSYLPGLGSLPRGGSTQY